MSATLATKRGAIGGHGVSRAALWACLAAAVLLAGGAAWAGQMDEKARRFLRPEPAELPIWRQVEPGKAEIFERPTPADPGDEIRCLALNIYFEARGEPEAGRVAVAHVVMNRVKSGRFPATVCDVVRQGGELRRYRCQFSWWCDGRSDRPRNRREWQKSSELALAVYWGRSEDPTQGALWYHADYVRPAWRHDFERGAQIGRHIFYRQSPRQTQLVSRFGAD